MNPTPTPNNNNRPPEFDDRIMAYLPGLRKLAGRYRHDPEQRNDLVTDTIIYCLEHWQNFREDGGMWNWLSWQMRGIVSGHRDRRQLRIVDVSFDRISEQPRQQGYAELSAVLGALTGKGDAILLRRAMGDTLLEIGDDLGLCRERVRQIETEARRSLRRRMGMRGQVAAGQVAA